MHATMTGEARFEVRNFAGALEFGGNIGWQHAFARLYCRVVPGRKDLVDLAVNEETKVTSEGIGSQYTVKRVS
jgi:hypothetical protein